MTDDAQMRRELRQMLEANGVQPERATVIVDLACHASEAAITKLIDVIKTAPDGGATMMALEMALQLCRERCRAIFERTHEFGKAVGAPQYGAQVSVRA